MAERHGAVRPEARPDRGFRWPLIQGGSMGEGPSKLTSLIRSGASPRLFKVDPPYARIIRGSIGKPASLGHSMSGRFVQLLLQSRVAQGRVGIDPAPPVDVFRLVPSPSIGEDRGRKMPLSEWLLTLTLNRQNPMTIGSVPSRLARIPAIRIFHNSGVRREEGLTSQEFPTREAKYYYPK